ncbi:MAG TPA: site-specific integrase [Verrucomicrobiae bacterium]|nr:site-specific integrase [Verrucomicrobiae bacterium]
MSSNSSTNGRLKGVYLRGKVFWYRYSYEGHQYRVSLETDDEAQAITKALRVQANPVLAGADPLSEEITKYVAVKQEEGTYTRNSADSREAVLRAWTADRALKEVRQIDSDEIKTWLSSLRRGKDRLQQSSIESYGMIIRGFCGWLVTGHKLRENPAAFIKSKSLPSAKRRRFCQRDQVDDLINGCTDIELKFIQYAGFHAGMRKDEIIQARPEWFDLKLNIIHITETETFKPKDKDKRTIPLTKAFRDFLVNEMMVEGELPGPFLIQPNKQQRKSRYRYDFRKPFAEYMKEKGFAWVTPHIMRHTFASLLAIKGVSIFKIAKWLGDDVKVVERHYAHLMPQDADIERAFGDEELEKN